MRGRPRFGGRAAGSGSDRYELLDVIGHGTAGVVHLARDRRTRRYVAVKTLRGPAVDELARLRFLAEQQVDVEHPNLIRTLDWYHGPGVAALVSELADGGSLADVLAGPGPIRGAFASQVASDLLAGLAHLHAHDVVHRDIKPANVLLCRSDGRVVAKLGDFGLAIASGRPRLTQTDSVVGTLGYVAPEVLAGAAHDHRSDIWALGRTLEDLAAASPEWGRNSSDLVAAMTAEDPRHRPSAVDARAMLDDDDDAAEAPLLDATVESARRRDGSARRRRSAVRIAGLAAIVGMLVVAATVRPSDDVAARAGSTVTTDASTTTLAPATVPTTTVAATTTPVRVPAELADVCGWYSSAASILHGTMTQLIGNYLASPSRGARQVFGDGEGYLAQGDALVSMRNAAIEAGRTDLAEAIGRPDSPLIETVLVRWLASGDARRADEPVVAESTAAARPAALVAASARGDAGTLMARLDALDALDRWFADQGCVSDWRRGARYRSPDVGPRLREPVTDLDAFYVRMDGLRSEI